MQQGKYRMQDEPIYDSFLYPAAAGPIRQRVFAPLQGANDYQTNLRSPGRLSGDNAFNVRGVGFLPEPDADPRDVGALIRNLTDIYVNPDIRHVRWHGWHLPAGAGVSLAADQGGLVGAVAFTFASNGVPHRDNIRVLAKEARFTLEPSEQFYGESDWTAIRVLQAAVRYWVYLFGVETRPRG